MAFPVLRADRGGTHSHHSHGRLRPAILILTETTTVLRTVRGCLQGEKMLQDPIFGPGSLRKDGKARRVTIFKIKIKFKKKLQVIDYFDLFSTYLFPP